VARWGPPGSAAREDLRAEQRRHAERPTNATLASSVIQRLASLPDGAGIPDLDPVVAPVSLGGSEVVALPATLVRKVERALEAPIEELVERRIVPSSEVLARVLPQISSHVAAATFDDDELRDLFARTYAAFRRRRSLLLLDLQSQVTIGELPWVRALEPFRTTTSSTRLAALDTLQQVTLLAYTSYPQAILPNPLLTEMRALGRQAEVELTLVEEVAADIFMGAFTAKWRDAAAVAASELEGSLYARYYSLPAAHTWLSKRGGSGNLLDRAHERLGKRVADDFAGLCGKRAREAVTGDGSWVAQNGSVIEQSQILTTQNLAPVVAALDLEARLEPRSVELATRTFRWIVRQQNTRWNHWRAELQMMKNTAYAWRQAVYFLSLVDLDGQRTAGTALREIADEHPGPWRGRFEQVIVGLDAAIDGSTFDGLGRLDGGRRFLGWSVGPHWLFPGRRP
jgi:hypothetical protein